MTTLQEKTYDVLMGLSTEQAVDAFLNWHGTQLLDDGFREHLIDEGYMEEEEEEEEETL